MREDLYEDIMALPHHQSPTRKRMGMVERAAQFSPFAALTGYGDCIKETARVTEARVELDESRQADISEALYAVQQALEERPRGVVEGVTIDFFKPDARKDGGDYRTVSGAIKKVDDILHLVVLADGTRIPMEDITGVGGAFFEAAAL